MTNNPSDASDSKFHILLNTIWRNRGINSLLGRYLVLALSIVAVTVFFALTSNNQIMQTAKSNSIRLSERVIVNELLNNINYDLWQLNTIFQTYMLVPNKSYMKIINRSFTEINDEITLLNTKHSIQSNHKLKQKTLRLKSEVAQLRDEYNKTMEIRINPLKVYPIIPIAIEKLYPSSKVFFNALTISIQEGEELNNKQQQEILKILTKLQITWSNKINRFRLFIASRIGIYNIAINSSIINTQTDINIYNKQINQYLEQLTYFDKNKTLGFQQSVELKKLYIHKKIWDQNYKKIRHLYEKSKNSRLDAALLKSKVYPLFNSIWGNLHAIKNEIEFQSSTDIKKSTKTADRVSDSIWYLMFFIMAAGLLGTLFFEFQIRRPIKRVSSALKDAASNKNVSLPHYNLTETNDLVTAFINMRNEVAIRQERLQSILNNTVEGIITFDQRGIIESWNNASEKLFGWSEDEVIGTSLTLLISSAEFKDQQQYLNYLLKNQTNNICHNELNVMGNKKNGNNFPISFKSNQILLNSKIKYIALIADITQQKEMMRHLRYLAEHDGLTGLHNRVFFNEELKKVVEKIKRNNKYNCAILYIDLDNFKYVNDTLGHAAGDKVLIDITHILKQRTRKIDLLARLGGDEFVLLINEEDPTKIDNVANEFRKQIADYSLHYDGKIIDIGCSIGVAIINSNTKSTSEAMSQADVACHFAKRAGRNRVHIFSASDSSNLETMSMDMGWARRIKQAIEHDHFILALQAIVNTETLELESYEVLIRLKDENNKIIMPFAFLPTAERFGLAVEIDIWVLENAIQYLSRIHENYPKIRFSINLSAQSLTVPKIPELIPNLLSKFNLSPESLTFEVTETSAIAEMDTAVKLLSDLQKLGCKTSLDDFGSGMSSFAYLRELPVDIVKIDGSFVKNMSHSPVDQAMLNAMNDIAHALGKQTVAEFVEDDTHVQLLKEFGVDYLQGYYIDKPQLITEVFPILMNDKQHHYKQSK